MTRPIVGMAAALLIAAAMSGPVAAQDDRVLLTVLGPSGQLPTPRPDYTLEVGDAAWTIDSTTVGGGLISVDAAGPLVVRLRLLSTCEPVVRFVARPGSAHVIRFLGRGAFRVEDWTENGLDALGGFPDAGPLVCPRLPDTSTVIPDGAQPVSPALPLIGAAFVLSVLVVVRRVSHGRAIRGVR